MLNWDKPNKLLAKLASELQKPDGLTVHLPTRIWPLPARSISGIGPKANAKIEALGIHTAEPTTSLWPTLAQDAKTLRNLAFRAAE